MNHDRIQYPRNELMEQLQDLRSQVGIISEVINQIDTNIIHNNEVHLDRLDRLKDQITRENQKLMTAIRNIRHKTKCNLKDPTTYIRCIEFIYRLIFNIFVFLCHLTFVVGNSFNTFLSHLPFPFSILVMLSYALQTILIFIIFDATLFVSSAGVSHRSLIPHNSLFTRYNGAPEMITPNMALYEGLTIAVYNSFSALVYIIEVSYDLVLRDVVRMVRGVGGRYITHGVVNHIRHYTPTPEQLHRHVVEPVIEQVKETIVDPVAQQAVLMVNEVVNGQLDIIESLPNKISEFASETAESMSRGLGAVIYDVSETMGSVAQGMGSLAQDVGTMTQGMGSVAQDALTKGIGTVGQGVTHGAQSFAQGVGSLAHGAAAHVDKLKTIEIKNFTDVFNATRKYTSKFFGGTRKLKMRKSRKNISKDYPVFSILTKTEQLAFDRTIAGKRIKKMRHMINTIDYSNLHPNPEIFYMIHFVLNVSENIFPIFIKEFNKTIDACKLMKRHQIKPITNPLFLRDLKNIVNYKY